MLFTETRIRGVFVIEAERRADERGFFARTWCQQEFAERGLNPRIAQCGTSFNPQQGTLRGLHYQAAPHAEAKLVRCTRGAAYDVVVDLRADSPTPHAWFGAELTAENRRMIYLPEGCAHGFLTLADDTEVFYQMSQAYHPGSSRGVRWDDPGLGIRWPHGVRVISERDRRLPLLSESAAWAPMTLTDSRG
jgi:dTDP-4-dehydrorhamnose 3,5-epimerase